METFCRGKEPITCPPDEQLDIIFSQRQDVGTLVLLSRPFRTFAGDLKIVTLTHEDTSNTNIGFNGGIDINLAQVEILEFTIKENYEAGVLMSDCNNGKFLWNQIMIYRERELTLFQPFTIEKSPGTSFVQYGNAQDVAALSIPTTDNYERLFVGTISNPGQVDITFDTPQDLGHIVLVQRNDDTTSYRVRLYSDLPSISPDEEHNNVYSARQAVTIDITIPLTQKIEIDNDCSGCKNLDIRKIFFFQRYVAPCSLTNVKIIDSFQNFINPTPDPVELTFIVGSSLHSQSVTSMRDWSDNCTNVIVQNSFSGTLPPSFVKYDLITQTTPETYFLGVDPANMPTTADQGTYTFTVHMVLLDQSSGNPITSVAAGTSSDFNMLVHVKSCTNVQIDAQSLNTMTYDIGEMAVEMTYAWPVQSSWANPSNCGPLSVRNHPQNTAPISLQLSTDQTTFKIILQTNDSSLEGQHADQLIEVFFVDFPGANNAILDSFNVDINDPIDCSVTQVQSPFSVADKTSILFDNTLLTNAVPISANSACPNLAITLEEITLGSSNVLSIYTITPSQINFAPNGTLVSQIGTHYFNLKIQSADPDVQNEETYGFTYTIQGCTETQIDPVSITSPLYTRIEDNLSQVQLTFSMPISSQSPLCGAPFQYSLLNQPSLYTILDPTPTSSGSLNIDSSQFTTPGTTQNELLISYSAYTDQIDPQGVPFEWIRYDCTETLVQTFTLGLAQINVKVNDPPVIISVPEGAFTEPSFDCGPIEYYLKETYPFVSLFDDQTAPQPRWILQIHSTNQAEVGDHTITLQAKLTNYPNAAPKRITKETLTLYTCDQTLANLFNLQPMLNYVGSDPVTQNFIPSGRSISQDCGDFSYEIDGDQSLLTLDFDPNQNLYQLTLEATLESQANQEYSFQVLIGLKDFPLAQKTQIPLHVTILPKVNSPPQFTSSIQQQIQLTKLVQQSVQETPTSSLHTQSLPVNPWNLYLPSFTDEDTEDTVTISVEMGTLSTFATYDASQSPLVISIEDLNSQNTKKGFYMIVLTLDDGKEQVKENINIQISEQIYEQEQIEVEKDAKNSTEIQEKGTISTDLIDQHQDSDFTTETQILGGIKFSWQVRTKKKVESKIIEPLRLRLRSLTSTGNLTVEFNKPIRIPHLIKDYILNSTDAMSRNSPENSLRLLSNENKQVDPFEILRDIIQVELLNKDDYDSNEIDSDQNPYVLYYNLTRFTPSSLDIQIKWHQPDSITPDVARPDQIRVWFKTNSLFVDQRDFQHLEQDSSTLTVDIVPQITQEQMNELVDTSKQAQKVVNAFTTMEMIFYTLMGSGLKYLWHLINTLQFLVFMQKWRVTVPYDTLVWLQTLKAIALFEFIPKKWFTDSFSELFGFEIQNNKGENGEDLLQIEGRTNAELSQKTNIVENMGVMLLLALVLLLAIGVLRLIRFAIYYDYRIFKLYQTVKQRIFYNTICRYILQSTLKLQIASLDTIVAEYLSATMRQTGISFAKILIPSLIVVSLILTPFFFVYILRKNRSRLPYLPFQRKFGTLYLGLNAFQGQVEWYNFMFLLRRFIFVILTYAMIFYPGIQVQIFCFVTVLYLIFANYMRYYGNSLMISLENFNEAFFLVLCYHFVLYCNLLSSKISLYMVGRSLLSILAFMIVINSIVVARVCLKDLCHKMHEKALVKERARKFRVLREERNRKYLAERKAAALEDEKKLELQKSPADEVVIFGEDSSENGNIKSGNKLIKQIEQVYRPRQIQKNVDFKSQSKVQKGTNEQFDTQEDLLDSRCSIFTNQDLQNQFELTNDAIIGTQKQSLNLFQSVKQTQESADPYQVQKDLQIDNNLLVGFGSKKLRNDLYSLMSKDHTNFNRGINENFSRSKENQSKSLRLIQTTQNVRQTEILAKPALNSDDFVDRSQQIMIKQSEVNLKTPLSVQEIKRKMNQQVRLKYFNIKKHQTSDDPQEAFKRYKDEISRENIEKSKPVEKFRSIQEVQNVKGIPYYDPNQFD